MDRARFCAAQDNSLVRPITVGEKDAIRTNEAQLAACE
jgi:hypothetical protein